MIVAESESHYIIERGIKAKYYGSVEKGQPLSTVKAWKSKGLYLSAITKGNFERLREPKKFTQK